MAKLWQKNYTLDSMMEHFTVRNDYVYDEEMIISDALGSVAQAKGLNRIGSITDEECRELTPVLDRTACLRQENA